MDIYQVGLKQFWPSPCFSYEHGGLKNWWFLGQNQVTMAGSVWDRDSSWKVFITSNQINTNRKTWFRDVLAPAILPACAWGGQKWLILRSKSGNNGRVIQGPWNQSENSLKPQITSILMGKHDIGPLWLLPPSLPVHRGSKMADFEVKISSQWQGHPGTLELTWKLLNASNHNYINMKTW